MTQWIEDYVKKALEGDKECLEKLILSIKDKIYNLSLRMLWNPLDAEDVTQEILIKVFTNLSRFRGESKFTTWVYRIASNHLMNVNKKGMELQEFSFELMEKDIAQGFETGQPITVSDVDREILAEELKISCTHAMLLCLDREHRLVYILSAFFGVNSQEAAQILEISPEAYRKRLQRARERMREFMEKNCGLVNDHEVCDCKKRVEVALLNHRVSKDRLMFVGQPCTEGFVEKCKEEMEEFDRISAVFRSNPFYLAPAKITDTIKQLLDSTEYHII